MKHNLNQHVARVHEKKSKNQCKSCDRIFQNRDDLKIHMKEVHDDTISKPQSPGILWTQNPDCKILKAKTKETTTFERDSCDNKTVTESNNGNKQDQEESELYKKLKLPQTQFKNCIDERPNKSEADIEQKVSDQNDHSNISHETAKCEMDGKLLINDENQPESRDDNCFQVVNQQSNYSSAAQYEKKTKISQDENKPESMSGNLSIRSDKSDHFMKIEKTSDPLEITEQFVENNEKFLEEIEIEEEQIVTSKVIYFVPRNDKKKRNKSKGGTSADNEKEVNSKKNCVVYGVYGKVSTATYQKWC